MDTLYNIVIHLFVLIVRLTIPFNKKSLQWIKGRQGWERKLKANVNPFDRSIWIHCASLGEFEQGRPVIEAIRERMKGVKVVLTFFSPSGYEVRKNYLGADYVCYLPADTKKNAKKIVKLINPRFVIIVKYEFWHNYISVLHQKNIPLYLISGIFRPEQHFFKWYGGFFRNILRKFEKLFVQDNVSYNLLTALGINTAVLAGDSRFDRVAQISAAASNIPVLEKFRKDEKLFLAGSSWKQDEEIIVKYINRFPEKMKWVFAPHEIDSENIERLEKLFSVKCVRFSEYNEESEDARVMIIDNIGMLSSAYKYAYVAAIGGGFGKGIHNILEPACWRIPVMFGPRHKKFREAIEMINGGGAMCFDSFGKFSEILDNWLEDEKSYLKSAKSAGDYINKNLGATDIILNELVKNYH